MAVVRPENDTISLFRENQRSLSLGHDLTGHVIQVHYALFEVVLQPEAHI